MKNKHRHEWRTDGQGRSKFRYCGICGTRAMPKAAWWGIAIGTAVVAAIAVAAAVGGNTRQAGHAGRDPRPPYDNDHAVIMVASGSDGTRGLGSGRHRLRGTGIRSELLAAGNKCRLRK